MQPSVAVPTYQQAYDSLGSTYDPQTTLVNNEISALPGQQQSQLSALDQAKVNAFSDINTDANTKGVLFSGFSPTEQASYVGTKYLPAVANLQTSFTNQQNTLQGQLNTLNAQRISDANSAVSSAQKAASTAAYKNAELAISASKTGSSAAPKALTSAQIIAGINQGLSSVKGKDGYVSPQDYASAYSDWLQSGHSGSSFDNTFGQYMNPTNNYYGYAKSKVK